MARDKPIIGKPAAIPPVKEIFSWPIGPIRVLTLRVLAARPSRAGRRMTLRSEEHTSELQSLMRISYAVFCLKKKKKIKTSSHISKEKKKNKKKESMNDRLSKL